MDANTLMPRKWRWDHNHLAVVQLIPAPSSGHRHSSAKLTRGSTALTPAILHRQYARNVPCGNRSTSVRSEAKQWQKLQRLSEGPYADPVILVLSPLKRADDFIWTETRSDDKRDGALPYQMRVTL